VTGAIGIVLVLLLIRLRAHSGPAQRMVDRQTQARIERIRAERAARMNRRR
jgi:hypothetical protein